MYRRRLFYGFQLALSGHLCTFFVKSHQIFALLRLYTDVYHALMFYIPDLEFYSTSITIHQSQSRIPKCTLVTKNPTGNTRSAHFWRQRKYRPRLGTCCGHGRVWRSSSYCTRLGGGQGGNCPLSPCTTLYKRTYFSRNQYGEETALIDQLTAQTRSRGPSQISVSGSVRK